MRDQELIVRAAAASRRTRFTVTPFGKVPRPWDPLHLDEDAEDLEKKLDLHVTWLSDCVQVGGPAFCEYFADHKGDKQAARRRATVRAAAGAGR